MHAADAMLRQNRAVCDRGLELCKNTDQSEAVRDLCSGCYSLVECCQFVSIGSRNPAKCSTELSFLQSLAIMCHVFCGQ